MAEEVLENFKPHALHSVFLPWGPGRHSGDDVVPQNVQYPPLLVSLGDGFSSMNWMDCGEGTPGSGRISGATNVSGGVDALTSLRELSRGEMRRSVGEVG